MSSSSAFLEVVRKPHYSRDPCAAWLSGLQGVEEGGPAMGLGLQAPEWVLYAWASLVAVRGSGVCFPRWSAASAVTLQLTR